MATTIIGGDTIQFTSFVRMGGQYAATVFNYRADAVAGGVTDSEALEAWIANIVPLYKDILSDVCVYYGTRGQIIHPTRRPNLFSVSGNGAGSLAGDLAPTQTAGIVSLRTDRVGKSYRGRNYFPGVSEASNDINGKPNAGYLTALDDLAEELYQTRVYTIAPGRTVELAPVVFSRKLNAPWPVASFVVEANWATQRRRATRSKGDTPPT